ncbi:carbon storage regulator [Microbulbifer epialgicus]|uniref:Carbon storage regulator n=1 Tax=Microbulbifer epialgicus TaxID=393907 RepID=A0ABV4P5M1_9GAMM
MPLKRRSRESLRVRTNVSATVLGVEGNQVKIGIPPNLVPFTGRRSSCMLRRKNDWSPIIISLLNLRLAGALNLENGAPLKN